MGGRGGSFGKGVQAFSYSANGRTMYVQRGAGGLVLLNGQAKSGLNFDSLVKKASTQSGFKTFTAKEVKAKQETRYKNYNSHDYEAGTGKGANTRGMSKLVYRPKRGK